MRYSHRPASISVGSPITYTLVYTNLGAAVAHQVTITDVMPAEINNASVISAGAIITPRAGSRFVWDVADLGHGKGGVITITALVSSTFAGTISNTAYVATETYEQNLGNNTTGPILTTVNVPDLRISKQGPANSTSSQAITYTLDYKNIGLATAHQVVITDLLPSELISASVTFSGAITPRVGSRYVWDVTDLAPGASGKITITAIVNSAFSGTLTNTATIASATYEQDMDNNTAGPVLTTVIQVPDLRISKQGPANSMSGSTITYTLDYKNIGFAVAHQVVITDLLPSELISASVTFSGAIITPRAGSRYAWDVADLAPGASGKITITAVVSSTFSGVLTNTAYIASATYEQNLDNNIAGPVLTQVKAPNQPKIYLPLVLKG